MNKLFSYISFALTSVITMTSVSATATGDANLGTVAGTLNTQVSAFGNLLVVLMMVIGFFCLYKIVMTFMNRDDERAYPMKNLPMYFAGAAVGLGSTMASDLVQNTLFGKKNDKLTEGHFQLGSK